MALGGGDRHGDLLRDPRAPDWEGLKALLGEAIAGVVCSDRWRTYNRLPPERGRVCWAHLERDLRRGVDRGGEAEAIGRTGREASAKLFSAWWDFRQRAIDRERLQAVRDPLADELRAVLERGCGYLDIPRPPLAARPGPAHPSLLRRRQGRRRDFSCTFPALRRCIGLADRRKSLRCKKHPHGDSNPGPLAENQVS